MSFTAQDVMTLRKKTGLGMMDCKKALTEHNGDACAAESWLREQRKGKMDQRTERATAEGRIGIAINENKAAIVQILTETDFTARNERFIEMTEKCAQDALNCEPGNLKNPTETMTKLIDDVRITTGENANFKAAHVYHGSSYGFYIHHDGKRACLIAIEGSSDQETLKGICQHIVFHDPKAIDESGIDSKTIETVRSEAIAEAQQSGKPEEIAQKIAEGRIRKYIEENCLLSQKYVIDESKQIKDLLGDNAKVKGFTRYTLGQ